ncbi:hypothetical protein BURPS1106B_A0365 [Burkholderia pseudomallei 1106b]|nr:hypothetical protein BURPS1106B_A0365 [Burkholderia pseudomallei 1106b]
MRAATGSRADSDALPMRFRSMSDASSTRFRRAKANGGAGRG